MLGRTENGSEWHLCETGTVLYLRWSDALDKTAPAGDARVAKSDYIRHRKTCKECTEWRKENGI